MLVILAVFKVLPTW